MKTVSTLRVILHRDAHRRLFVATALGGLFYLLPIPGISGATHLLLAWDLGVLCFLVLAYTMMVRADAETIRMSAMRQDPMAPIILALVVVAAGASLFAIGFLLHHAGNTHGSISGWILSLSALTIVCSWLLTHTMFALHYAHLYYGDLAPPAGPDEGLLFPGGQAPDYLDFVYFSFVIAQTAQVSDVQITSRSMRRVVWIHGILSFWFYTSILALTINIIADFI